MGCCAAGGAKSAKGAAAASASRSRGKPGAKGLKKPRPSIAGAAVSEGGMGEEAEGDGLLQSDLDKVAPKRSREFHQMWKVRSVGLVGACVHARVQRDGFCALPGQFVTSMDTRPHPPGWQGLCAKGGRRH